MNYDFSEAIDNNGMALQDFIDSYTSCVTIGDSDDRIHKMLHYYKRIFSLFEKEFSSIEITTIFEELALFKISNDIPYIIMSNEIYSLKNLLITNMSKKNITHDIMSILLLFKEINNRVAHIYLLKYTDKLISLNTTRRNSLSDLVEKEIMQHYESHLIWLSDLAKHIKDKNQIDFPQRNEEICSFGLWLNSEAKILIQNNSKYATLKNIHKNLHLFAKKIYNIIQKEEYHILITYLEKCELISLSIGTELALLDNILINKKVAKDSLTGALSRQALRSVFESQYELSLATSNPFILAMCDLDYFKKVNDTYGHVAGDKLLTLFVTTVKKNIRNSDIIIRYGGEEFVIILPTIHKEKGIEVLNKICKEFEHTILEFNGEKIQATVSFGMMVIEPQYVFKQSFIDEYIMIVDKKLYTAKELGRNRVEVH